MLTQKISNSKKSGILFFISILSLLFLISLAYGYTNTNLRTVYSTYFDYSGSSDQVVIQTMRMPRAIIALLVGASLATSGAIMQALTRNPMASSGVLGINAGAGLSVVVGMTIFSISSMSSIMWLAFLGAFLASIMVYMLGSFGQSGLTPLKLTMSGVVLSSLFSSITTGLLILNDDRLENVLFWLAGSVEGRGFDVVGPTLPFVFLGLTLALAISGEINALLIGEDSAKSLGQKTWLIKGLGLITVVLLSGSAVAMAGPIGFIGIVVPHIVRGLIGIDYRWILPYCMILGAILLIGADILARFILFPIEVPVGVATSAIGAPFFIYIARKGVMK